MQTPQHQTYDVVIIGGAMIGSSTAWFLKQHFGFTGKTLVIDRDLTYENASTSHTNSCVRRQFSSALNIQISQFTVEFVHKFQEFMGNEPDVPDLKIRNFGYLYLADNEDFVSTLRERIKVQNQHGVASELLSPEELIKRYPFYNLDDIILGSLNTENEGYFEGSVIFEWFRRNARRHGAEYIENEVVKISRDGHKVQSVTLKSGEVIKAGIVVNASGPRAAITAAMAGINDIPIEPRARYTYIFDAETPLDRDLPLTIDPTGIHLRTYGDQYMAGCPPDHDVAVDPDDFTMDHSAWENKVWPVIASRIPAFEAIKLAYDWVGHYAYNTFDHNAVVGLHPDCDNFIFVNGFSGHGLQQSPAMGRGTAELIIHGEYRSLDLTPLSVSRLVTNKHYVENAVI